MKVFLLRISLKFKLRNSLRNLLRNFLSEFYKVTLYSNFILFLFLNLLKLNYEIYEIF